MPTSNMSVDEILSVFDKFVEEAQLGIEHASHDILDRVGLAIAAAQAAVDAGYCSRADMEALLTSLEVVLDWQEKLTLQAGNLLRLYAAYGK